MINLSCSKKTRNNNDRQASLKMPHFQSVMADGSSGNDSGSWFVVDSMQPVAMGGS